MENRYSVILGSEFLKTLNKIDDIVKFNIKPFFFPFIFYGFIPLLFIPLKIIIQN